MRAESAYGELVVADTAERSALAARAGDALVADPALATAAGPVVLEATAVGPAASARVLAPRLRDVEPALLLRYLSGPRPAYTRLPFDYRRVPSPVRAAGLALLDRAASRRPQPDFPAWPLEARLDDERAAAWRCAGLPAATRPTWPEGRPAAVLLTHDIDSRDDIDGIGPLQTLEGERGFVAAIGFVPEVSWPGRAIVEGLGAAGYEVYCHDERHDGQLPYRGADGIRRTFERFFDRQPWARPLVRGFRAGQLLMSGDLAVAVRDWFDLDLSIPTSERGGPYRGTAGCGTVFPFWLDRLLELPLTLPQDYYLFNVDRQSGPEIARTWVQTLVAIVARGGVAVVNTHPVWTNPRRPPVWDAYVALLDAVTASGAWVTTPSAARDWLASRRA